MYVEGMFCKVLKCTIYATEFFFSVNIYFILFTLFIQYFQRDVLSTSIGPL